MTKLTNVLRVFAALVVIAVLATTISLSTEVRSQSKAIDRLQARNIGASRDLEGLRTALREASSNSDVTDVQSAIEDLSGRVDDLEGSAVEGTIAAIRGDLFNLHRDLATLSSCVARLVAAEHTRASGFQPLSVYCV